MALVKTNEIYEVLIRFSGGKFQGAAARSLERIADSKTGEVFSEKEMGAEPITAASLESLLTSETADMLAACSEQVAVIEQQAQAIEAREAEIALLTTTVAEVNLGKRDA